MPLVILFTASLFFIDVVQLVWRCFFATLWSIFHLFIRPAKKPLNGETVLITGAAHGIGRELALEFGRKGASLVLWDVNEEGLEQAAADVRKLNVKAAAYRCDVTDRDSVKNVALRVWEEVGNVTILVNNAGILSAKPFISHTPSHFRKIMEVNVMSHYWTIMEFLPKMIEMCHGHIVAMSSFAGKCPVPNLVPYCTSKYAVTGLMDSLSEELRYYQKGPNVQFTSVYPIIVNTGMVKDPRIKYAWFAPIFEPADIAKTVVDGVQRNEAHIYIPKSYGIYLKVMQLLPRRVQMLVYDFLDSGVNPQEDKI